VRDLELDRFDDTKEYQLPMFEYETSGVSRPYRYLLVGEGFLLLAGAKKRGYNGIVELAQITLTPGGSSSMSTPSLDLR